MKYWVVFDHSEEPEGPYTIDELVHLGISKRTSVCLSGTNDWRCANECPGLQHLFMPAFLQLPKLSRLLIILLIGSCLLSYFGGCRLAVQIYKYYSR
jgi:uncharacterized protein DUF4339